jgi:ATP-binding cassette subfamily F protein 3
MDELQPLEGSIRLGASVKLGYLPQSQAWLDGPETVLDYVLGHTGLLYEGARALLGRFLFSDEDMDKPLSALSGGERSRLALAQLTLKGANLLILDEPTSHLDLAGQEVLQQVLMGFSGTLLFVSHDRYLVNALATHIWWIDEGSMRQYEGGYTAFLSELERERTTGTTTTNAPDKDKWAETKRRERQVERRERDHLDRIQALENEIAALERDIHNLSLAISQASEVHNMAQVHVLSSRYAAVQTALADRLRLWETEAGEAI